jgi:hypothetical protein
MNKGASASDDAAYQSCSPWRTACSRKLSELTPALLRLDPMFGARENLKQAVAMLLQANREFAEESLRGTEVVRESRH